MNLLLDIGSSMLKWRFYEQRDQSDRYFYQGSKFHAGEFQTIVSVINTLLMNSSGCYAISTCKKTSSHQKFSIELLNRHLIHPVQDFQIKKMMKMKIAYPDCASYGVDRAVAIESTLQKFTQSTDVLLIGCGTITTFDCIEQGVHTGGALLLSPYETLQTVSSKLHVGALPSNNLSYCFPATNTTMSAKAGTAISLLGAIAQACAYFKKTPSIVLYGGYSYQLSTQLSCDHVVQPFLIFDTMQKMLRTHYE
ncbi:MAG: type III pantothenate kinase [Methylacidiphilales bacterium]|nr:type III pantothenate kinase [Candidatus Methylacidiphilales bacterium]